MIKKLSKLLSILLCICILITLPAQVNVEGAAIADLLGIKDDTGGFVADNTYDYFAIGKLSDFGTKSGEFFTKTGQGVSILKYKPEKAAELISTGNKLIKVSNFLRGFGQVFNIYNTGVDTYKLFTEESKHETTIEKTIDKGLLAVDVGLGWYAIGAGAVAIITAPAWGTGFVAAAGVTGTTYLVGKLGVGATRIMFNSKIYKDLSGLIRGTKKITFAPFQRPGMKEGLDIIKEEFGFDLYPGLKREIPDPSTGIPVYKPNIYLYSDEDITVNVKLYPAHYITISDPLYPGEDGWVSKIIDGSLNGSEDYLFYEAIVPDEGFQKESAWQIKSDSQNEDILSMLKDYGFNEKEINDFTKYWVPRLESDKDYLFYPQINLEVDMIMPLIVSPSPENVFRIWFYIIPFNGESIKRPNQQLKIVRNGLTVVEWGGILP